MNEAMTQPTAEAVNAQFTQQMAMEGLMDAVRAMQNLDMSAPSLMDDAANVVAEVSLATPTLTEEGNVEAYNWQLQAAVQEDQQRAAAAAANEAAVRDAVNSIFDKDEELVDA